MEPFLPPLRVRRDGHGRPPASHRTCFEGSLWGLRTGARWRDVLDRVPSGSTCWRRLQQGEETGVWLRAWRALLADLDAQGLLDWEETFLDGSFAPANTGGSRSGRPSVARARRGWSWSTARGCLSAASWRLPRP
ncbi:MAG: DDE transposase, partial [Chloroflexota bacterium]